MQGSDLMAKKEFNVITIDKEDAEALKALYTLEQYCLKKNKYGEIAAYSGCYKNCIVSCLINDCEECPFDGEDEPRGWEISESLFNAGLCIKHEDGKKFTL